MNPKASPTTNSMGLPHVRLAFLLIPIALACLALTPQVPAACQDACLSNSNTVQGDDALISLTIGVNNTAVGFQALFSVINGDNNTAVGRIALQHNTDGLANTVIGAEAMRNNTTGDANAAVGVDALLKNTTGNLNVAIGTESLKRTNGSNNIGLGYEAGMNISTGSNTICIGHPGETGDTNTIRIGTNGVQTTTFMAGVSGATVADGVGVVVGSNGQLGTIVSSAHFKKDIKPMNKASESILALKPVSFHYKHELDPNGIPQFGLLAEQVEKVNPDLVARDEQGKPYTVRYEAVNAMLLNEFLKEHKAFVEEQRKVGQLEANTASQQKQIEALTAGLQKVSAQIELSKTAPQTVVNWQKRSRLGEGRGSSLTR